MSTRRLLVRVLTDRVTVTSVLACGLILWLGLCRQSQLRGLQLEEFHLRKTSWSKCADVVVAGDSRTQVGISPAAMRNVIGHARIYNFAFAGGGFSPEYLKAIGELLDPLSRYRVIVLGISPRTFTPEAWRMNYFVQASIESKSGPSLRRALPGLVGFCEPMGLSGLWSVLLGTKRPASGIMSESFADGWEAVTVVLSKSEQARIIREKYESYRNSFRDNRVAPESLVPIMNHVRTWTGEGIRVFAFRPPTSPEMVAIEDQLSELNYEDFKKRFQAAGGIWVQIPQDRYQGYDGSHLERMGAERLSIELAHELLKIEPPSKP